MMWAAYALAQKTGATPQQCYRWYVDTNQTIEKLNDYSELHGWHGLRRIIQTHEKNQIIKHRLENYAK